MVWFVALHMVSCLKGHKMGVLWWGSWVYVAYADCYFGFKPDLPNFSILLPWWGEVVKVTSSDGSVISFRFVLKSLLRVFKIRNRSKNSSAKKASSLVLPKGWACRQARPQLVPSDNQHLTAIYALQFLVIILRCKPTEARKSTLLPVAFQSVGVSICTYVYNHRRRCLRRAKNCTHPGVLYAMTTANSEEESILLLSRHPPRGRRAGPGQFGRWGAGGLLPAWPTTSKFPFGWSCPPLTAPPRKQSSAFHLVIVGSAPGLNTSAPLCWEEQPPKGAGAVRSGFSRLESWRDHISKGLFPAR